MTKRIALFACIFVSVGCTPSDDSGLSTASEQETGEQETDEHTDEAETGDDAPNLGICEQYIDCVEAATPEIFTGIKATYGSAGTCWTLPGISESDCHTECRAMLRAVTEVFPDVEECFECIDDSDCTSKAPYCNVEQRLCSEEQQVRSCDLWEPVGYCREFGEGFTNQEKRDWCAALDQSISEELYPDPWMSERPTLCTTDGALGRCDYYNEGSPFEGLVPGPVSIFYYGNHPKFPKTAAESQMSCVNQFGGTWTPF